MTVTTVGIEAQLAVKGDLVADLPAPLVSPAPNVTTDTTATTLRTCTVTFADPDGTLKPRLAPTGAEIILTDLSKGVATLLGTFGLTARGSVNSTLSNAIGPVLTIAGQDRAQMIGASKVTDTFQTQPGIPLTAATVQLLQGQVPWLTRFRLNDLGITLPAQIVDIDADPWATCVGWWNAVGLRLSIARDGTIIGGPPSTDTTPSLVWGPGTGLIGVTDTADGTQSYNGITVIGANPTQVPVRSTVWNNNPRSKVYAGGPFGRRPAPSVTVDTAQTVEDCYRAGVLRLPTIGGLSESYVIDLVPDPGIEPWAVSAVTSPRDGLDADARQVTAISYTVDGGQGTPTQATCIPVPMPTPMAA